jgi:hypothetical protein
MIYTVFIEIVNTVKDGTENRMLSRWEYDNREEAEEHLNACQETPKRTGDTAKYWIEDWEG